MPAPAPCLPGQASWCPTGPATPSRVDAAGLFDAGLAGCGVAPPPFSISCDAVDFGRAVASGDGVEVLASAAGFIWVIGDAAKFVIKGGKALIGGIGTGVRYVDDAAQAGLHLGGPGYVYRNALTPTEFAHANEIVSLRGGTFVGAPVRHQHAWDGTLDGVNAQLKSLTTTSNLTVNDRIRDAAKKALESGTSGELYLNVPNVPGPGMLRWVSSPDSLAQRTIGNGFDSIFIRTNEGWIVITSGT